jgi:RND family efflux transporter MFP subunit
MKARIFARRSLLLLVIFLVIGTGIPDLDWTYPVPVKAASDAPQTSPVRQGDLRITVNGSGSLVALLALDLQFSISGVLSKLNVAVGDQVQKGDVLAKLDDRQAELDVKEAQLNWDSLTSAQATADAEQRLLEDQQALSDAQEARELVRDGPPVWYYKALLDQATTNYWGIYGDLQNAKARLDQKLSPEDRKAVEKLVEKLSKQLAQAKKTLEKAQDDLDWALHYQPDPHALALAEAQAGLAANQLAAQDVLVNVLHGAPLLAVDAISDSNDALLALERAHLDLEKAQWTLEQTALTAPVAGTIMDISLDPGERVDGQSVLTLTAMDPLFVRFYLDEGDLAGVSPGDPVNIHFDAYPDQAISGWVSAIDPTLVNVDGTQMGQVWAELDANPDFHLFPGMSLDVEVLAAESKDTLLVPLQALIQPQPGAYAVQVVGADGAWELRPVTVGLRDTANVEIRSGLSLGEMVSLEPQK